MGSEKGSPPPPSLNFFTKARPIGPRCREISFHKEKKVQHSRAPHLFIYTLTNQVQGLYCKLWTKFSAVDL